MLSGVILCILVILLLILKKDNIRSKQIVKENILPKNTIYPTQTSIPTAIPPTLTPTLIPTSTYYPGAQTLYTKITYYGWADNTPPGTDIAFPHSSNNATIHSSAGGIGSYDDPITFATDQDQFAVGTKLYVPYLRKYIIMEDLCGGCTESWNKIPKEYHIDIWMNSIDSFAGELLACEHAFTRKRIMVEINPPQNREVNLTPLFDINSGACYTP